MIEGIVYVDKNGGAQKWEQYIEFHDLKAVEVSFGVIRHVKKRIFERYGENIIDALTDVKYLADGVLMKIQADGSDKDDILVFRSDDRNNEFNRKVIDDEYFSFGLKIKVLEKLNLEVYPKFFVDIRRINNIRNIFAHKVPTLDEGFVYQDSKKGNTETQYMSDLHKEFLEKIKNVDEQLGKIFFNLVEENKIIKNKSQQKKKEVEK